MLAKVISLDFKKLKKKENTSEGDSPELISEKEPRDVWTSAAS